MVKKIVFAIILVSQVSFGQMMMDYDYIEMQDQEKTGRYGSTEEKLDYIQAQFLKELFVKQMFSSKASLLTEEEREESIVSTAEFEMTNDMMATLFSQLLAKEDVLQLKKLFLNQKETAADK